MLRKLFCKGNAADLTACADFTFWLRDLSSYSSAQLDKAREHFRRGARLERKNDLSFGEASRWLAIVSSVQVDEVEDIADSPSLYSSTLAPTNALAPSL